MTGPDPDEHARRLAAESLAVDDPTGWFERLYAEAETGETVVPWDRGEPHRLLVEWAEAGELEGGGRRALVVGCGPGHDAAYVAGLGFDTVAFDVAATAVEVARRRYPDSGVRFHTADLLNPPAGWREAFDLVVESHTVQALPGSPRPEAIANVAHLVAPGGTLIVIAAARDEDDDPEEGPPWPLTRAEIDSFTSGGLRAVRIEDVRDAVNPSVHRWRAQFHRPRPGR
jgi:SAM-dependent methyltransferase